MQILSTLIFMITTFFKKLKIQELLKENLKKTEKFFFTHKLKFFEILSRVQEGGGG